jgi:MFS family permease
MLLSFKMKLRKRQPIVAFALLFNTFAWYYLSRLIVTNVGNTFGEGSLENLLLGLAYPSSIVLSAIAGSILLGKMQRTQVLKAWLLFGVGASQCSTVLLGSSFLPTMVATLSLGISLGLGLPSALGYFAEAVSVENRGKAGGIILFGTFFSVPLIFMFMSTLDLVASAAVLVAWRIWCVPLAFLMPKREIAFETVEKPLSFNSVLRNRTFALYFIAWFMFGFIDSFETVVVNHAIGDFRFVIKIVEPAIAAVSTLVGGIFADWIGRKRVLIFGFVSLGVAFAILGLFAQFWFSWLFYFITDGVALGLLWVLFIVVLWGDVSPRGSERVYAVGETPFFLTDIFSLFLMPYLALIPESSSFSLAAFFLFLAVLPLLYAPETLPQKRIRERELKQYVEKAMKVKEKYT